MRYCTTPGPIMWRVAAECPRCGEPLILRHDHEYRPFLCCATYPHCRFVSGHDELINALLDHIVALEDALEDSCGRAIDRTLP